MTRKLIIVSCAFIMVGCLAPAMSWGDEIVLDNGNHFTGTVTGLADDIVTMTADYAEPFKIKKGHITRISTDNPVSLQLTGGEIIKGKLKTGDDGRIVVDQGDGRTASGIDLKDVVAINPPPIGDWHGSVSLAGNLQTGNTDRSGLSFGADALRRGGRDRFSMRFLYNISQENGEMTTRNVYGAWQYDYFFTKKFYGYLGVELLNDKFKDLNLRTVVGPGVGYQVWDDPIKFLSLEAGIAYFSEDLREQEDKRWMTLRLAANYRYKLTEWLVFNDRLVLYPSLESMSDFTLRNEAALLNAIGSGWSLKLANILDYVNNPSPGIKSTDSVFTVGLQYAF